MEEMEIMMENKLKFRRFFTPKNKSVYETVTWGRRDVEIIGAGDKKNVFSQKDVEFPVSWSQRACVVTASKYFHGKNESPEKEKSLKQLINRVVDTITLWGEKDGYFNDKESAEAFKDDLKYLVLHQYGSFNSPVWFNVGIHPEPQCSACFINSVEDTMDSILELAKTEGMLFKYGSGAGVNLSPIRSSKETLSGGGIASGPVSFMKGYDAFAGVIKSGGTTRRAAKMVILNADHPDIEQFIDCKINEEKKAKVLIDAGYDGSIDGEAYGSVFFQNANNSVRVTNEFMKAYENKGTWDLKSPVTGEVVETVKAESIMDRIAEAAHGCGDPGMQFDTTINLWHTCPASERINASNPCSEFMFIDNTSCNLASLNLKKFLDESGNFSIDSYLKAIDIFITAQEILVDRAGYPTEKVRKNSHRFRPLGLGYSNLGAMLMSMGISYDSDEGRDYASLLTAILTGQSYCHSSIIASIKGPFFAYSINKTHMLRVIKKHKNSLRRINPENVPENLYEKAEQIWKQALNLGKINGFRNSQVTVMAPTGTISFMMDCDTTGIEPEISLVKYKTLVGGGNMKIVNKSVKVGLYKLGYSEVAVNEILRFIDQVGTIEGAPGLKNEHLSVFDCAFKPINGERYIQYIGHINMMAAIQPFISGAISKTVNLPNNILVKEIRDIYFKAWKLGLKSVTVYRDGSKLIQPLNQSKNKKNALKKKKSGKTIIYKARRKKLPDERKAITHKFDIGGHEGYVTVGMYEDGTPGEVFVVMAKQGSVINGLMDSFATSVSLALQYGVPLKILADKFKYTRFEPSGITSNPKIRNAKSIIDYLFQWLTLKFTKQNSIPTNGFVKDLGSIDTEIAASLDKDIEPLFKSEKENITYEEEQKLFFLNQQDSPPCSECGSIMIRSGSCYKCLTCGATSGCS